MAVHAQYLPGVVSPRLSYRRARLVRAAAAFATTELLGFKEGTRQREAGE
jgi:hypothetical protein